MAEQVTLTVHRATHQIGGNCIEIAYGDHRILLDAGDPLDGQGSGRGRSTAPSTLDLTKPVDAVVISHPHQDHYGLLQALPAGWPVWSGKPTEILMKITAATHFGAIPQTFRHYTSDTPFEVGPFAITPYLTDHSAFDAHMIQVDVGGTRIFYSGDFRTTGRKGVLVERLIAHPPRDVDVLLLEGTTLGRDGERVTEEDVQVEFESLFRRARGRVFVSMSGQNVDRIVKVLRACTRTRRSLVVDFYTAYVLERLSELHPRLPTLAHRDMWGVYTTRMGNLLRDPKRLNAPEFVTRACSSRKAFGASKLGRSRTNVIMLRGSLLADYDLQGLRLTSDDTWVFSMWSGYLRQPEWQEIRRRFDEVGASFEEIHTSGHASPDDLARFARAVGARHLVPIHGDRWDEHAGEFANVRRLRDGEAFEVDG